MTHIVDDLEFSSRSSIPSYRRRHERLRPMCTNVCANSIPMSGIEDELSSLS